MRISSRQVRTILALASTVLLAACSRVDNFSDLQAYFDEVNSRPSAPIEPVPQFVPYEGFIYGAASLRSPFAAPVIIDTSGDVVLSQDVEPDFDRIPELLENHSLSELSMVGMLNTRETYEALIEDAFGEIHRVGVGEYMGRNYGQIRAISSSQVSLIEIVPSVKWWLGRATTNPHIAAAAAIGCEARLRVCATKMRC